MTADENTAGEHPHDADGKLADDGRHDPVADKAAAIAAERTHPPTWKAVVKRAVAVAAAPVSPGLVHTAVLGIAAFALLAVFGSVLLLTDRPLALAGRAAQWLRNRVTRGRRAPMTGLDTRLLVERDTIR